MDAGRYDDAFEVIRDACAGPFDGITCRGVGSRLAPPPPPGGGGGRGQAGGWNRCIDLIAAAVPCTWPCTDGDAFLVFKLSDALA